MSLCEGEGLNGDDCFPGLKQCSQLPTGLSDLSVSSVPGSTGLKINLFVNSCQSFPYLHLIQ